MTSREGDHNWIDGSLFTDQEPPDKLTTLEEQVDFLVRLCAAWDFGILPDQSAIEEIRKDAWRNAVDQCRLLTSPTYHMLREWHELERLPYLGRQLAYIRDDPYLENI